jgi:hypothetical protein
MLSNSDCPLDLRLAMVKMKRRGSEYRDSQAGVTVRLAAAPPLTRVATYVMLTVPAVPQRLLLPLLAAAAICTAIFAVYPSVVQLDMTDPVTHRTFRAVSAEDYGNAIAGRAPFPYQWRMLGPWVVRAGERATHADPHAVDVAVKVAALAVSIAALFLFAAEATTIGGAYAAAGFYAAATAGAYASQGYSIYFTSDYLMIAAWFCAVLFMQRQQWTAAAAAVFAGAWAKETLVVAPILAALLWWRGRAPLAAVIAIGAAFALPTVALRVMYQAPLGDWAWWHALRRNVPFADLHPAAIDFALRNNLKVLLFYNVGWWLGFRRAWRARDGFTPWLAATLVIYVALAYVVVYIRELRHVLPVAILIVPMTIDQLVEWSAPRST